MFAMLRMTSYEETTTRSGWESCLKFVIKEDRMTVYRCDCHKCTNKVEIHNKVRDGVYCKAIISGQRGVYIEEGHAGTREDPDPVCCDQYTTEVKNL